MALVNLISLLASASLLTALFDWHVVNYVALRWIVFVSSLLTIATRWTKSPWSLLLIVLVPALYIWNPIAFVHMSDLVKWRRLDLLYSFIFMTIIYLPFPHRDGPFKWANELRKIKIEFTGDEQLADLLSVSFAYLLYVYWVVLFMTLFGIVLSAFGALEFSNNI